MGGHLCISPKLPFALAECEAGRDIPLRRTCISCGRCSGRCGNAVPATGACDLDRRMEELEMAELPLLRWLMLTDVGCP